MEQRTEVESAALATHGAANAKTKMTEIQETKMSNTTFAAWSIGKGISIKFPSNLLGRAPHRCC
jgi:hypothetical protein